jgi:hypothetical protein
MGYNLWLSDEKEYTLGHRMGRDLAAPGPSEHAPTAFAQPSAEELDRIDFLMETLARRLETAQPAA